MKTSLCVILTLILHFNSFGQQNYFASYTGMPAEDVIELVPCGNNSAIVASFRGSDSTLSLFKLNAYGVPVSGNNIKFPYQIMIISSTTLSDSNVAFLLKPFYLANESAVVLKVDDNCNVIWIEGLQVTGGAEFFTIAPLSYEGGMVLAGGGCAYHDMLLFLDYNGNITSQSAHENPAVSLNLFTLGLVNDGNNNFTGWGENSIGYFQPAFYSIDSLGNINDVTIFQSLRVLPGFTQNCIVESSNGGHFCIVPLEDSVLNTPIGLFYFNSANQFVWAKTIENYDSQIMPVTITATKDNGCIITGQNLFNNRFAQGAGYPWLPFFMKFDSQGTLQWMKMVGDTNLAGFRCMLARSAFQNFDNELLVSINSPFGGGACIANTDTLFNGICHNTTTFNPVINSINPPTTNVTTQIKHLNFYTTPIAIHSSPVSFPYQTICGTTGILAPEELNSNFYISPNPNNGSFRITSNNYPEPFNVKVFDVLGNLVYESNSVNEETSLDVNFLPSGVYFCSLIFNNKVQSQRFLVNH